MHSRRIEGGILSCISEILKLLLMVILLAPIYILLIAIIGFPFISVIINIVFLCRLKWEIIHKKLSNFLDLGSVFLSLIINISIYAINQYPNYTEPIILDKFHSPISYEHSVTILFIMIVASFSFSLLKSKREKLPPLPFVLCLSTVLIGMTLCIVYIIQLTKNFDFNIAILYLYPINFILCSIRLLRLCILEKVEFLSNDNMCLSKNRFIRICGKLLSRSIGWLLISYILMIPILAILLAIIVMFGQSPDSIIKTFTYTADWTFSQKIPPPPIEHQGHYLCTVALRGSPKLVKPLGYGIRNGQCIVVNRQLCVANAFEQYLMERIPRFHKIIRNLYDCHGYPLSKKITTKTRANLVYIIMKPLEWFFVFFLYTMDTEPENRIALQYTTR